MTKGNTTPSTMTEPKDIDDKIDDLTDWITDTDTIPKFTDRRFLLSFLQTCKYDQDATRKRVTKYWESRKTGIMRLMNGIDPSSDEIMKVLRGSNAVYVPFPDADTDGRRVILARWSQLDVSGNTYSFDEWFRAITVVFDALCMLDDGARENGVTFLMDANQVSLKHLRFFGFGNSMRQFDVMQKGYPIRIKKVHYINNNTAIDIFFNTVKVVISSKLSERIKLHGYCLAPMYDQIGLHNLPQDYLPDDYEGQNAGQFTDIMEKFIQDVLLKPDNLKMLQQLYACDVTCPSPHDVKNGDNTGDTTTESETDGIDDDIDKKLQDLKL